MSDPIQLHTQLLARGQRFADTGRTTNARATLQRLLNQPGAPSRTKAEAHRLLGEIELAAGRCRRARRHFAAAIGLCPFLTAAYVRYAAAIEVDADAEPAKGLAALRRAICLDPEEPTHWTALGRLAIRAGDCRRASRAFRRAVRLAAGNWTVLAEVVDGFVSIGRRKAAREVLIAARFQAPNDAGLARLWDRFRFDCACAEQARAAGAAGRPILQLPERVAAPASTDIQATVIRADRRSVSRPHFLRLFRSTHGS